MLFAKFQFYALLMVLTILLDVNVVISQANVDSSWLSGLSYRNVGPTRGGRATAIAGIAAQPFTFFFGATGGGVWKTEDAGLTWNNISDGQINAGSIGAIEVAASDPNVIYVGTGSACPRGNVSPGIGIYGSTDGGKNWRHLGLNNVGQIGKIVVHPHDPSLVFVAALGQIFGPNPDRGIFRSKDGGKNWQKVLFAGDTTGAVDLAMDPQNPRMLYAALWRAERKPWTLIDGGLDGGIWKSVDGGDTWLKLEAGLPTGLLGRIGIAVSPANPKRIWAIINAAVEDDAGLYRSDDGGESWSRICRDHALRQRGWYYSHITADPKDENTVYVNNVSLLKSVDGGKTFDTRIRTPHGDHHGLWVNPDNPQIMINCNDGGACVSLNGGKTWSTQHNQPTSEFYRVTVDNQFPYYLYAGQQDNSTISVPSKDPGGVTDFEHWHSVGGSESADVGVNPLNPDIVWATSYSGEITYLDRKTGFMREVTAYPHYTEGTEQRKLKYRWQWNFPVLVSRFNPNVVFTGSNYIHRTDDKGQTWKIISPDLTRDIDKYHGIPGGPIQHDATGVEVYCSVFALEESPFQEGELWAGTDDGRIHISRNGGVDWQEITPGKIIPLEGTINKIELSSHAPGRALVAIQNYRNHDYKPYILLTSDYGKNWKLLTNGQNGIPEGHFVRAIAEDPDRKGLFFAGTEFGIYLSFDEGRHWQPFQLNLPVTPITDIEIVEKDLVFSTQGRAFWVLDDLSHLHQLSDAVMRSEKHLFLPRNSYHTNIGDNELRIRLYLKTALPKGQKAQLEILDNSGHIIRTLSTDADNKLNKITLKEGLNEIRWNLHHEGPELVKNLVTMTIGNPAEGPMAAPGNFQVRVTIGDWSALEPFQILKDPRWTDVSESDYLAQQDLCLEIRDMITDSQRRIKNLRSAADQLKSISEVTVKAGYSRDLDSLAKQITRRLTDVEDQLIQNKSEVSQDNINYPRVFSNHIARLYQVATQDHHRPTGGVLERYEDLKKEYAGIVVQYKKVMEEELPEFNYLLEKVEAPRVVLPERVKEQ